MHPLEKYKAIYAAIFQEMRVTTGSQDFDKYVLMYRLAYHSMPLVRWGRRFKFRMPDDTFRQAINMLIDYEHPAVGKIVFSAN